MVSDNKLMMGYVYGGLERDSELLGSLDTADVPVAAISPESDSVPAPNDVDVTAGEHLDSEPNEVAQRDILSETTPATLDTDGTRGYTHAILAAVVIGLAAVAFTIARKLRKK
jgi:hypothetical protein